MGPQRRKAWRVFFTLAGGCALVLVMLHLAGFFGPGRLRPGSNALESPRAPAPRKAVRAAVESITDFYEAVGTLRPRSETRVEAQITARIMEIRIGAGARVAKGEFLIGLDDRELQVRLEQAREGLKSAVARREQARQAIVAARAGQVQAESEYRRIRTYFQSEAATAQDLERAEAGHRQAGARLQQAEDGLKEAAAGVSQAEKGVEQSRIALGYARILAPAEGEVVRRLAEPGDLAWPGKPLMTLQTRGALRLEAVVREGLIHKVAPGAVLRVAVDALAQEFEGNVEEVVPSADPATRTFLVKVNLPEHPGLMVGMFGRLLVPLEERRAVVVPQSAVRRVGQLEVVVLERAGRWERAYVKTGRVMGEMVEILAGLQGDETLAGEVDD